jgi:hypothetical protein
MMAHTAASIAQFCWWRELNLSLITSIPYVTQSCQNIECGLDKNVSKGFIRISSSPTTAPMSFVSKGDSSLRLVIDYRGINEGSLKNRYLLLLLQDTPMNVSKAK